MADIKIYLVEESNFRRWLARVGFYLVRLNKFDTVIAASNNCFVIPKKIILVIDQVVLVRHLSNEPSLSFRRTALILFTRHSWFLCE